MIEPTIRGHNGGPPLDEPVDRRSGQCKHCIHWDAPPENEQRAYEWFRLDLSRRRVKRRSGTCDRVLLPSRKSTVFSATSAEFECLNFEAKPLPVRSSRGGFVTIWRNGRIAWQGPEENIPPRFLQDVLDRLLIVAGPDLDRLRRKIDRQEAAILALRRKYRVNAERPQHFDW